MSKSRPRNYKAEYQRRKALNLARGMSVSQARGHAKKNERSVSEVKRLAKETGIPIQRLQKVEFGTPGETETDWRTKNFTGTDQRRVEQFISLLPDRTRIWIVAFVRVTGTIHYPAGDRWTTILTNRTKRDVHFPLELPAFVAHVFIWRVRFKPL